MVLNGGNWIIEKQFFFYEGNPDKSDLLDSALKKSPPLRGLALREIGDIVAMLDPNRDFAAEEPERTYIGHIDFERMDVLIL